MMSRRVSLGAVTVALLLPVAAPAQVPVDVARLGTAAQTTSHGSGLYPARLAIDGDTETFSHTDTTSPNNAWVLTLDTAYPVSRVEVVMRDCCSGRLNGAFVRLFDDTWEDVDAVPVVDGGAGSTFTAPFPANPFARHVRIGFEGGDIGIVHPAEVRVFAPIGYLPVIDLWAASSSRITQGQSVRLSWSLSDADGADIRGIGPISNRGQTFVAPTASTVYLLTATNKYGSTAAAIAIEVDGQALAPRISEFMAAPGEGPDWIEIWNPGVAPVNLAGYHLTDDPSRPTRWTIPTRILQPGEFVVIGAGGAFNPGGLQAPFALAREAGSYVALTNPAGLPVSAFTYPSQQVEVSYGGDLDEQVRYFLSPTPGSVNRGPTTLGFTGSPRFSASRGFYESPFQVTLTPPVPRAAVYYTTDCSTPAPGAPTTMLCTGPVAVAGTTVLRAIAIEPGTSPSFPETHTYLFADRIVKQPAQPAGYPTRWLPAEASGALAPIPAPVDYEMDPQVVNAGPFTDRDGRSFTAQDALRDIPTFCLSLDTPAMWDEDAGLHANARLRGQAWERPASLEIIDPTTGRNLHTGCGIRIHGGRTRVEEMLKKSFRLYFRRVYGAGKLAYPLFPGAPADGFDHLVLRGGTGKAWDSPWRDLTGGGNSLERVTYVRDQFLRESQRDLGHASFGGTFVHLYINGLYWGLYNPVERPGGDFVAAHFGGEEDDYDVLQWANGLPPVAVNGDRDAWNELIGLSRSGASDPITYAAIGDRLDLARFVEFMLLNFYVGNIDWVLNNAFAFRPRTLGGRFQFLAWDGEELLLSLNQNSTGHHQADSHTELHHDLKANREYRMLFADQTYQHLVRPEGALNVAGAQHRMGATYRALDRAIVGESARWGDLFRPHEPYTREDHWLPEISHLLRGYLRTRPGTTMSQLRAANLYPNLDPPVFLSQRGGEVPVDYVLALGLPDGQAGTIYYTMDGSDPRRPGGTVSASAHAFTSDPPQPVALPGDVTVRSRALRGSEWSAINQASFTLGDPASDIVVSEIMYHPTDPTAPERAAGHDDDAFFEYIELLNIGPRIRSLSHLRFSDGIEFDFAASPIRSLAPGERVVLVARETAFRLRYGTSNAVAGAWSSDTRLDNGGETIRLDTAGGAVVRSFAYNDRAPWPVSPDGGGTSLVLIDPFSGPDHADPGNWRAGVTPGGTPGGTDAVAFTGDPRIDRDRDGLPAYLEHVLGTSDGNPLSGPGAWSLGTRPDGHLELRLSRNLLAEDAELTLQASGDLAAWSDAWPWFLRYAIIRRVDGTGDLVYRTVSPPPSSRWFLRLQAGPRKPL